MKLSTLFFCCTCALIMAITLSSVWLADKFQEFDRRHEFDVARYRLAEQVALQAVQQATLNRQMYDDAEDRAQTCSDYVSGKSKARAEGYRAAQAKPPQ